MDDFTSSDKTFSISQYYALGVKNVVLNEGKGLPEEEALRLKQHLVINFEQLREVTNTYKSTKPVNNPKKVVINHYGIFSLKN